MNMRLELPEYKKSYFAIFWYKTISYYLGKAYYPRLGVVKLMILYENQKPKDFLYWLCVKKTLKFSQSLWVHVLWK